ncbi:hypothetical protein L9F63_025368, partial [Diploptera punctata]
GSFRHIETHYLLIFFSTDVYEEFHGVATNGKRVYCKLLVCGVITCILNLFYSSPVTQFQESVNVTELTIPRFYIL